ncbi:MAG TPA: rod shape-determining protein RodA [bacterium]|nr:rod shape-determining protein RodA [bacterium]
MADRRSLGNLDWTLLITTLALIGAGILSIYSASRGVSGSLDTPFFVKQLWWLFFGVIAATVVLLFDYRTLIRLAYPCYALSLLGLIYVLFLGRVISGAQRWIIIGPLTLQPSEFMKISLILTLANYFEQHEKTRPWNLRDLFIPAVLTVFPALLIAKEPDLGTALVILIIFATMAFIAGMNPKSILLLAIVGLGLIPLGWSHLMDYQRSRILTLFNPELDPLGTGYHLLQSKIAVGSGGLWGKGLWGGTQSRLNFLPEKHTDFIFSVFSENMGFLGSSLLLILYFIFLMRTIDVAYRARDSLGALLAGGIACMFTFSAAVNVAMTVGLAPVVGIPLPLISYGGSALLASLTAIGLLINVHQRRFKFSG